MNVEINISYRNTYRPKPWSRFGVKPTRYNQWNALDASETLEITLDRDLRSTQVYRSTLDLVQDYLSEFESALCDSLIAQVFTFQGYTFHQDTPNYFRWEEFVHHHVPLNSMPLLTQVEDMSIGHLTDSKVMIFSKSIILGSREKIIVNKVFTFCLLRWRIILVKYWDFGLPTIFMWISFEHYLKWDFKWFMLWIGNLMKTRG